MTTRVLTRAEIEADDGRLLFGYPAAVGRAIALPPGWPIEGPEWTERQLEELRRRFQELGRRVARRREETIYRLLCEKK